MPTRELIGTAKELKEKILGGKISKVIPNRSGGIAGLMLENGIILRAVYQGGYGFLEGITKAEETHWPSSESDIEEYCNGEPEDLAYC